MKRGTLDKLLKSNWENDSNPQSAPKSCGLSFANPQDLPRLALLVSSNVNGKLNSMIRYILLRGDTFIGRH